MPEVNTAPLMDPLSEAQQAGVGRRLADKEAAARRLRARGFSYRRIAETLRIRYDTVSRWLYGEPEAAAPVLVPVPAPMVAAAPVAVETPQRQLLEARLTALEVALARFQEEATQREERLLAELTAVREALEESSRVAARPRFLPWSRGKERA